MALERYHLDDKIHFAIKLVDNGGNPLNGEDIRVSVAEFPLGTLHLDSQSMPEVQLTGYYFFEWTHGFTAKTQLVSEVFQVQGNKKIMIEIIKINIDNFKQTIIDTIDDSDGSAI